MLAPRECEQLGRQFCAALGSEAHVRKPLLQLGIIAKGTCLFDKSNVAEHHCEEVIEVVSDA